MRQSVWVIALIGLVIAIHGLVWGGYDLFVAGLLIVAMVVAGSLWQTVTGFAVAAFFAVAAGFALWRIPEGRVFAVMAFAVPAGILLHLLLPRIFREPG